MEQMITLPRSVVAALVDPEALIYAISRNKPGSDEFGYEIYDAECRYCGVMLELIIDTSVQEVANPIHAPDCPIRQIQEALGEHA